MLKTINLQIQPYLAKAAINLKFKPSSKTNLLNSSQQTLQSLPQVSTSGNCHSDDEDILGNLIQEQFSLKQKQKNSFFTNAFQVKFHCQKTKLKEMCLFKGLAYDEEVQIKITLMKKCPEKLYECFEDLKSIFVNIKCSKQFLELKQLFIPPFESSSIQIIILNCPITSYEQISKQNVKQSFCSSIEQRNLETMRKCIKKQRYQTFLLKKIVNQSLKQSKILKITLPQHFVVQQSQIMDEVQTTQILFFKYLAFYEKLNVSFEMLKEQIQHIHKDKVKILQQAMNAYQNNQFFIQHLHDRYLVNQNRKFKDFVLTSINKIELQSFIQNKLSQIQMKQKKQKIKDLQKCIIFKDLYYQHIRQMNFSFDSTTRNTSKYFPLVQYPLIFRDIYEIDKKQTKQQFVTNLLKKRVQRKKKYYVFAHGFQGLPIDLSLLINMIRLQNQKAKVIVLKSYKGNMSQSMSFMSQKIVYELKTYFAKINLKQIQPQITFIGHSMGSILLRAALNDLYELHPYFDSFISICSPHLGYIQGTKFLTETGLSLLSKISPIQSIQQLSNRDSQKIEETFMYKLSKQGSLAPFRRLVLVSCIQDNYVPWHSARIEQYSNQGAKSKTQKQMIENILGVNNKMKRLEKIERIQVNFPEKQKSINSIIGRTCHIKPLYDRGFLELFTKMIVPDKG